MPLSLKVPRALRGGGLSSGPQSPGRGPSGVPPAEQVLLPRPRRTGAGIRGQRRGRLLVLTCTHTCGNTFTCIYVHTHRRDMNTTPQTQTRATPPSSQTHRHRWNDYGMGGPIEGMYAINCSTTDDSTPNLPYGPPSFPHCMRCYQDPGAAKPGNPSGPLFLFSLCMCFVSVAAVVVLVVLVRK